MRSLGNRKFWCHLSNSRKERFTNKEIRRSKAKYVSSFPELVKSIAKVANYNTDYTLFFRGQPKDYRIKNGESSLYPTIFRKPGESLGGSELKIRFDFLYECSEELMSKLNDSKIDSLDKIRKFPELKWSLLQHYGVCDTPLLDATHSLRVAASFALLDNPSNPVIFVLGIPYPHGTISYSTEEELLNIRLLSASPSEALRPHFQEGYLLGTFPPGVERKHNSLDFGRRVIAKYQLPRKGFWTTGYHAIPRNALYPENDQIEGICKDLKMKFHLK